MATVVLRLQNSYEVRLYATGEGERIQCFKCNDYAEVHATASTWPVGR